MIERIKIKVLESIEQLYTYDLVLIKNNLCERTITHKLAEYLQKRFAEYNVDCEYNRDVTQGKNHKKTITLNDAFAHRRDSENYNQNSELLYQEYSTYPDIIIHRRESNDSNILIIEAKKSNSIIGYGHDSVKLSAFTDLDGGYKFKYGLFIEFNIEDINEKPKLVWFSNGQIVDINIYPQ